MRDLWVRRSKWKSKVRSTNWFRPRWWNCWRTTRITLLQSFVITSTIREFCFLHLINGYMWRLSNFFRLHLLQNILQIILLNILLIRLRLFRIALISLNKCIMKSNCLYQRFRTGFVSQKFHVKIFSGLLPHLLPNHATLILCLVFFWKTAFSCFSLLLQKLSTYLWQLQLCLVIWKKR